MKVFVLSGCDAYEMREVLGVYKSMVEARYYAEEVAREQGGFGYYEISVNELGGEATLMEVIETLNEEGLVDTVLQGAIINS